MAPTTFPGLSKNKWNRAALSKTAIRKVRASGTYLLNNNKTPTPTSITPIIFKNGKLHRSSIKDPMSPVGASTGIKPKNMFEPKTTIATPNKMRSANVTF